MPVRDAILTFVRMGGALEPNVTRRLPAGMTLGELTDGDLERTLAGE